MKIIAIGAVTAGGKTTVVKAVKDRLPKTAALYFDDYTFEGEVEDFGKWLSEGADCNVWDLSPLKADTEKLISCGKYEYLLLDYPFAYLHKMMRDYLDTCIFIDTPLDIALARRVLRDMKDASADDIRTEMDSYLKFARPAYIHMLKTVLPSSDHVIDGTRPLAEIVDEVIKIIQNC